MARRLRSHIETVACGMRRNALLMPLLLCLLPMGGCAPFTGYATDPASDSSLPPDLQAGFGQTLKDNYVDASDATTRRAIRDKIIYRQLSAYDLEFENFERSLTGNENIFSIVTDTTVLGVGAAGTIVGGETAKSALAAVTTFLTGTRTAVDKDLFYQSTLPALKAQMEAKRLESRAPIIEGLGMSDADYPLQKALVDLGNLRIAASLSNAVVTTTLDAGVRANAAQIRIDRAPATAEYKATTPDRYRIYDRLRGLSDHQAIKMVSDMQTVLLQRPDPEHSTILQLTDQYDPHHLAQSNGAAAHVMLRLWVDQDFNDPTTLKIQQWNDELDRIGQSS